MPVTTRFQSKKLLSDQLRDNNNADKIKEYEYNLAMAASFLRKSDFKKNAKIYPTSEQLKPKIVQEQKPFSYYRLSCTTLDTTVDALCELIEANNYVVERNKVDNSDYIRCIREIFSQIVQSVVRYRIPENNIELSSSNINKLKKIANLLIDNYMYKEYNNLIYNCPESFLLIYSNDEENIKKVLFELENNAYFDTCKYLIRHIYMPKLKYLKL